MRISLHMERPGLFVQSFVTQEWAAVIGRENSVNQNFGEGLGHGLKMQEPAA